MKLEQGVRLDLRKEKEAHRSTFDGLPFDRRCRYRRQRTLAPIKLNRQAGKGGKANLPVSVELDGVPVMPMFSGRHD
jgi:hypothetical protein